MTTEKKLIEVIRAALQEMERCPEDSVQDIFNEQLETWETGMRMNSHFDIEKID